MIQDGGNVAYADGRTNGQKNPTGRLCPNLIARVENDCSVELLDFYHLLGGTQNDKDHRNCDRSKCLANDIRPPSGNLPRHVTHDCVCNVLGPNPDQLQTAYAKGNMPLVCLRDMGDRVDLSMRTWAAGSSFVAISHALADGLCNLTENKLPECQLKLLWKQAQALLSTTGSNNSHSVLIWIDVLCMPVHNISSDGESPEAFDAMKQAMQKSTAVLVVDSDIKRTSKAAAYEEVFLRISYSSWNSRLWTLYEAMVASQLFFEFADGPISLDELDDIVRLEMQQSPAIPMLPYSWIRKMWSPQATKLLMSDPQDLLRLGRILKGRRTSSDRDSDLLLKSGFCAQLVSPELELNGQV